MGQSIFPYNHYAFWRECPTANHHLFSVVFVALRDGDRLRKQAPKPTSFSTALGYSAAMGGATLCELAEWDAEFVALFAPGALISASGLSERRDFPSK